MIRSLDSDARQMCEPIALFKTREMRAKRPQAHAAWTEHFP